MADIRFDPRIDLDLDEAIDFLGARSTAARRLGERFDKGVEQLIRFPESGEADDTGMRWLYLSGTTFSIVYQYTEDLVTVLRLARASEPESGWRTR